MSKLLSRHKYFILFLLDEKSRNVITVLQNVSKEQVLVISEIIHNLIFGTISISKAKIQKIARHKTLLRRLADRKISLHRRGKIVNAHPKIILSTLSLIRPTILSLLS